ncbi:MAG: hypothetical protein HC822_05950 [Oscillochloris sp.]|nr:hypothetical protein [Oscillochloris sp.]
MPADRVRVLGQNLRRYAGVILLPFVGLSVFVAPEITAWGLLLAIGILLWDRMRTGQIALAMRTALGDEQDLKLEVSDSTLGELAHHINRLRQNYRHQQRLLRLLGLPAASVATRLADLDVPLVGNECEVAVLAIHVQSSNSDRIESLREIAFAAQRQAETHVALLSRIGDQILLIFGALESGRPETHLRAAHQAALALHADWNTLPNSHQLNLSLAGGVARAVVLPGLGYSVIGPAVDQALALLAAGQPSAIVCSEPTYVYLRRLGSAPPLPLAPRLVSDAGATTYTVPL